MRREKHRKLYLVCCIVLAGASVCRAGQTDQIELIATKVDQFGTPEAGATREPMIVEHPDGTLFVAGYGSPDFPNNLQKVPRLWRSSDHGNTWNLVNVGTESDGAIGNSDVSLAMAPDGTLYFATMIFDAKTFEGVQITIGVSHDIGKTWHWKTLSKKRFDDRPWVAVAPDGAAHVIWNDGSGVYHSVSRDRGSHWSDPQRIHSAGGSSHLAIGPKGEIAVRIVPISASGNKFDEGVDLIAVSTDGGLTWEERPVPGHRDWAPTGTDGVTPRWVEPLAWDTHDALYNLSTSIKGVWLYRSEDLGLHWRTWKIADVEELSYYPYLTVSKSGEIAATWFSGAGANLRWQACRVQVSEGGEFSILSSPLLTTDSWGVADTHGNRPVRETAGEYLAALFLRDGTLSVVTPIQNPALKQYGFSFWTFQTNK